MPVFNETTTYPSVAIALEHVDAYCWKYDYIANKLQNETKPQFARRMKTKKIIEELREYRQHKRLQDAFVIVQQQAPIVDDNITVQ